MSIHLDMILTLTWKVKVPNVLLLKIHVRTIRLICMWTAKSYGQCKVERTDGQTEERTNGRTGGCALGRACGRGEYCFLLKFVKFSSHGKKIG